MNSFTENRNPKKRWKNMYKNPTGRADIMRAVTGCKNVPTGVKLKQCTLNISSDAEHENWLDHHSAHCHNSNSCHLSIMFQPTVPPWTPTEYLTFSDYTGPTINITHVRILLSACWQLFLLPPAQAKCRLHNLVTIYQTTGLSYPRICVSSSSQMYVWEETAQSVSGSSEPNYTCRFITLYGVNFLLSRDIGICMSWLFSSVTYTTNRCDSDTTNVVAMCDRRVSTTWLVNTTESVFNHLPSTDKYELRNARQVNRVLGLHHLDYVANCLPSTNVCGDERFRGKFYVRQPAFNYNTFANLTTGMENMSPKAL